VESRREHPRAADESDFVEGVTRIEHLKQLLGHGAAFDEESEDWSTDMSFVYLMALFLCGRCLRPLAYKVQT
jgi:hypothetical protein